jgi:glutamyl-tRNA reductase
MALFTLGINHHTAPLSVREQVAFNADKLHHALTEVTRANIAREVAILSTCNRTEIYCAADNPEVAVDWLAQYHAIERGTIRSGRPSATPSASPPASTRWSSANRRFSAR